MGYVSTFFYMYFNDMLNGEDSNKYSPSKVEHTMWNSGYKKSTMKAIRGQIRRKVVVLDNFSFKT